MDGMNLKELSLLKLANYQKQRIYKKKNTTFLQHSPAASVNLQSWRGQLRGHDQLWPHNCLIRW